MAISERVKRRLLARSGGYCMRPECRRDFFVLFQSGEVTSVEELAHIIADSAAGPRGTDSAPISQRDEYENILVLCPTCHSLIDKKPALFHLSLLRIWKQDHEQSLENCFSVPRYTSRSELAKETRALLRRNKALFDAYGPFSRDSGNPLSDAAAAWQRVVRTDVIPNNRRTFEIMYANRGLLDSNEHQIMEKFRIHKDALEYNHLSGDKNSQSPLFPKEMESIFAED